MNVLTTEHLGRSVGGLKLVDDICVQVRAGEVLVVVGPSGAGKSSFEGGSLIRHPASASLSF
jgi:ABC-type branched-subunit amino acid transport system ATPase component